MIEHIASPLVCVVDDEPEDYKPILDALNSMRVSAVHLKGDMDSLPEYPFNKIRLVFLDLHLSGTVGKAAASHTANVFTKIVPVGTAPVVVVIWSKYASDLVTDDGAPDEDQETEADLFKRTLLDAEPKYAGRLVFVEMAKPKQDDRPAAAEWTSNLVAEVSHAIEGQPAIDALWAWIDLVNDCCTTVSADLTNVAQKSIEGTDRTLADGLKGAMQTLVQGQGEGDLSRATAPRHFTIGLSQLLLDQIEYPKQVEAVSKHGGWLSEQPEHPLGESFAAQMNGLLFTADAGISATPFPPGTVYKVTNPESFKRSCGKDLESLKSICFNSTKSAAKREAWNKSVQCVLVEISPVCDVANGKRVSALLVGGLLVPRSVDPDRKKNAANLFETPFIRMRWPKKGFPEQEVRLLFCHSYRFTVPNGGTRNWIQPWFRLRELPTSAIRNANMANAARVGFVSIR